MSVASLGSIIGSPPPIGGGDALPWPEGTPDTPRPLFGSHISFSQLSTFQTCPERYRQRYLLGRRARRGAALIVGTAAHKAAAWNDEQKIDTGLDLPVDDVLSACAGAFDQAVSDDAEAGGVEWGDTKPGAAKDQAVALSRAYHEQAAASVQAVSVEQRILIAIPTVTVPLLGYVDIVCSDRIVERKFVARAVAKPEWLLQGAIYSAALGGLPVEWHVTSKTKTPTVKRDLVAWDPTPAHHVRVLERVAMTVRRIEDAYERYGADEAWDGDGVTHDWACSYCGHRSDCPWWKR